MLQYSLICRVKLQWLSGSSPFDCGSITTTRNGDLICAFCDLAPKGVQVGNNFSDLSGIGDDWALSYFIQQTAGSIDANVSFITKGDSPVGGMAAF
jgi:hypothetical protein